MSLISDDKHNEKQNDELNETLFERLWGLEDLFPETMPTGVELVDNRLFLLMRLNHIDELDDDLDNEPDETFAERLWGLTEMFPEIVPATIELVVTKLIAISDSVFKFLVKIPLYLLFTAVYLFAPNLNMFVCSIYIESRASMGNLETVIRSRTVFSAVADDSQSDSQTYSQTDSQTESQTDPSIDAQSDN